jgi:hypothetical protein
MKTMTDPKSLDTLVDDIYGLFNPNETHTPHEDNVEKYGELFKELLRTRLREREPMESALRFSSLGKKDRQLWYAAKDTKKEEMQAKTYFKFLYGDVIELLILFLTEESGHKVERMQEEIEVDGVKGHIDAVIDGVVVDVKSASPFSFSKFKHNDIVGNDPFGYVAQLSGYSHILNPGEAAAWIAFDKVHGDICVTPLSASIIADNQPLPRIEHLREVIASDEPPARCFPDEEDGKSGNRKLGLNCSYCAYKWECWPGLRGFAYAGKPRYLTNVAREPTGIPEIFNLFGEEEVADNGNS